MAATIVPTDVNGLSTDNSTTGNSNRVWVGNLNYKATEDDLTQAFVGLKVSDVSLPTRNGRKQGYAFVTFESEAEAEKAIHETNGKEIQGREMRVQKATSAGPYESTGTAREEGEDEPRRAGGQRGGKGGRFRRFGKPRRERNFDDEEGPEDEGADGQGPPGEQEQETGQSHRRRSQKNTAPLAEGQIADSDANLRKFGGFQRRSIRRGPPEDGIPSTTTVYVANIPFDYTSDRLKEAFAAYNPTSAHIVPRSIPRFVIRKLAERGEARKGRGFGFVTFEDEATQKRAVEEMNGKEIEGREIQVKVAIDKPEPAEAETAEDGVAAKPATNGTAAVSS